MIIRVNGESKEVSVDLSVRHFLKEMSLDENRIVIELNAKVLPKSEFSRTILEDGDRLELVEFVAGG